MHENSRLGLCCFVSHYNNPSTNIAQHVEGHGLGYRPNQSQSCARAQLHKVGSTIGYSLSGPCERDGTFVQHSLHYEFILLNLCTDCEIALFLFGSRLWRALIHAAGYIKQGNTPLDQMVRLRR